MDGEATLMARRVRTRNRCSAAPVQRMKRWRTLLSCAETDEGPKRDKEPDESDGDQSDHSGRSPRSQASIREDDAKAPQRACEDELTRWAVRRRHQARRTKCDQATAKEALARRFLTEAFAAPIRARSPASTVRALWRQPQDPFRFATRAWDSSDQRK